MGEPERHPDDRSGRGAATAAAASYHSGTVTDATKRPRLTIEYLPPVAPGAVNDVLATAGDAGLFTHLFNYRQPGYVNRSYNLRPGDVLFFLYRGENIYNHTAVVRGIQGGTVKIAQHGYAPFSTLPEIIARNNRDIVEIAALRPRSR
ncbi:hypothetical protein ACIF8W_28100 [Streptomyces sp. NPDC085639]|uniref:hypothetical protein n=1 Tax=Streptomyces sp. NPDC085639 TaxID=3365734 RepID=UPI0037D28CE9